MKAGDKVKIVGGEPQGTFYMNERIEKLIGEETTILEIDNFGGTHAHLEIDNALGGYPLHWLEAVL